MFRKMNPGEEQKAAEALTEAFMDYPLHRVLLRGCKDHRRYLMGIMKFLVYAFRDSVYVNDEINFVACVEKPEDNNPPLFSRSTWKVLKETFSDYPISARVRMIRYLLMSERLLKKHRQEGDCYGLLICTVGNARGSGIIFRFFMEVLGDRPFVGETHTERNKRLYERIGMEVCEDVTWHGIHHYVLRRPEDADCNYEAAIAARTQQ